MFEPKLPEAVLIHASNDRNRDPGVLERASHRKDAEIGSDESSAFDGTIAVESGDRLAAVTVRRSRARRIGIMLALSTAGLLTALDVVILGTALPKIAKDLRASSIQYSWAGSAYLLASASVLPVWVRLSDIFGRKPIMVVGYLLFLVGSLVSALSHSIVMLIMGRAIQGAGAGAIEVLINVCLADMFSIRDRGLYIAIYGAASGVGALLGPVLGGVLTGQASWRWCFWINLPISVFSLTLLILSLNLHNPKTPLRSGLEAVDWLGALAITSATIMFLLGLQFGGIIHPWNSASVIGLMLAGVTMLGIFVFLQWRAPARAIMPLQLFSHSSGVVALVICFCHGFTYVACLYFLPMYFQSVLEATPTEAGVWLLGLAGPLVIATAASGIIVERTGHYRPIIWASTGFLVLGYGIFIDFPSHRDWPRLISFQIVVALGIGPLFQAPLIALQSRTAQSNMSSANSAYSFTREIGSAVGLVSAQVLMQNRFEKEATTLLNTGIPQSIVSMLPKDFAVFSQDVLAGLSRPQQQLFRQVFTRALHSVWILETVIASVALLISFLIRQKKLSRVHQEVTTGLQGSEDERT